MSNREKEWEKFFRKWGWQEIKIGGDPSTGFWEVEGIYQMFKARLIDEMKKAKMEGREI